MQLGDQAQQDTLVLTGFLNWVKWNESGRSAQFILSISEQDQQGGNVYKSVPMTATYKLACMLDNYYQQMQQAKQGGGRMGVLVQVYMGRVSSFAPKNDQGQEGWPVVTLTAFRGAVISADQNRSVTDISDNYGDQAQGGAPQQQGGGFQQNAPQQQGGNQQQGGFQQQAPQQQGGNQQQGGFQQQGGMPNDPNGGQNIDFDEDIPF